MNREVWELYLKVIHSAGIGDIKAWTKLELTMPQLKVLMLLSHNDSMTIGQLADELNVSLPNMTGIIDRLEKQELVKRYSSEKDRRIVLVKLTEKAFNLFLELNQSGYEHFKQIENQLSDSEIEIVKLGLKVLVNGMEKYKKNKPSNFN